jgi:hypothetical protein
VERSADESLHTGRHPKNLILGGRASHLTESVSSTSVIAHFRNPGGEVIQSFRPRLRSQGTWAARRRAGITTTIAAFVAVIAFLAPTAAAAEPEWISVGTSYGYGGATFDWSGPGRASNIDLVVSDWGCDSNPVYAYFRVTRSNGGVWYTDTKRWDYSGCDSGDSTTYNNLSLSDDYNIAYLQVVICVRNGSCATSGASGRNPYA